jgi:hypothetical protein
MKQRLWIGAASVGMGAGLAATLVAGPLDPPSGTIAPSYKTLTEVEPRIAIGPSTTPGGTTAIYRIIKPGSYYLTENIDGKSGKHGIIVGASQVTIDLNGFSIMGGQETLDAIKLGSSSHVAIRNGTIAGWEGSGIGADGNGALFNSFENLTVVGCGGVCIRSNASTTIRNCTITTGSAGGIIVDTDARISDCSIRTNGADGVVFATGTIITRCISRNNAGDGFRAIPSANTVTIFDCVASGNTGDGIEVAVASIVRDNQIITAGLSSADGAGIHVTGGSNRIERNNIATCDRGVDVDAPGNIIVGNTCRGNTIDFSIVAGNTIGGIISATTNGSAINGSSAPGTIGTTDPWSNVCY